MHQRFIFRLLVCLLILNLYACGDVATLPEQAGMGPYKCRFFIPRFPQRN
jgi:hypothetical protein